uniref:Rho-GAP domain-containing protein n=1 Tax=Araucaria cunninghamii TaxID=56994 RepID=A0A0D6QZ37_ARACU
MGQNGIFRSDSVDALEGSAELWRDRRPVKSLVVGRPILLALEDIDGSPSFLEKALCFIEQYGVKVEGILRQAADVDEVDQRVREYEQGRNEFSSDEDAHVVGDCIKHVLRELPSSPVPAPCCSALLEAHRKERKEARITAMRLAVAENFPEPNRRLLQRVLKMMHAVASHTSENRMTASAVAACMAPLLLRPLLAGECELDDDSDRSGDNAAQLLAAAAAANNAQAIVTTLLEEYDNIFVDDQTQQTPASPEMYPQMDDSGTEGSSDDEVLQIREDGYHDAQNDLEAELEDDPERVLSGTLSESSGNGGSDLYDYKVFEGGDSDVEYPGDMENSTINQKASRDSYQQSQQHTGEQQGGNYVEGENDNNHSGSLNGSQIPWGSTVSPPPSPTVGVSGPGPGPGPGIGNVKTVNKSNGSLSTLKRTSLWNRNSVNRKNHCPEPTDSSGEDEVLIQRLEMTKNELRNKIAKEAKGNALLQASLERRKQALHERRLALEQDVARLQEQLQAERDLRAALEIGLSMSSGQFSSSRTMDSKTRAELEEIALAEADVARLKQKVAELHVQLNQQRQHFGSLTETGDRYQHVKSLQAQQKVLQQDLDLTLAMCQHERQKSSEQDGVTGNDWETSRQPALHSVRNRQLPWRHRPDILSPVDSKSTEASTSLSAEEVMNEPEIRGGVKENLAEVEGTDSTEYQRQPVTSSALVELTTRLDFFKERRSQLMQQLHNLDLTFTPASHGLMYNTSPPWTSPQ